MSSKTFLLDFRKLLLEKNEKVGELEMTIGNYDDGGELIGEPIPTITTDFCEIGVYGDTIYFVFVIYSESYNKRLFDLVKDMTTVRIYGFDDFKTILYPKTVFNYQEFEEVVRMDKYLQLQFSFGLNSITANSLMVEYKKIKDVFVDSGAEVINQLKVNLAKKQ